MNRVSSSGPLTPSVSVSSATYNWKCDVPDFAKLVSFTSIHRRTFLPDRLVTNLAPEVSSQNNAHE